jgi:methionine-rich copper-binding protein CopC
MYVLIFTLFVSVASAAVTTNLQNDVLTIGSSSQKASNFDRNQYGEYKDAQITFTSTSAVSLLKVTPMSGYVQSSSTVVYNINVTEVSKTFSGATSTVTINARIPENLPAVDNTGSASAFQVADLTFGDGTANVTVHLYMQRKNELNFDDVILNYGDSEELTLKDGKNVDKLKSGDSASIDFTIENTYGSNDDVTIEEITLSVKDDGNDLDIDEEEDISDISENDDATETISFEIDDELDEDTYNLILKVIGEDDYGARHGQKYVIKIEIEKEKDDLSITRLDLNPDTVNLCDGNSAFTLTTVIKNIGSNSQDEASISVSSTGLKYSNSVQDIELDEDDSKTKVFNINVPSSTKTGVYTITVKAENDDGDFTDEQQVSVRVEACNTVQPSETTDEDEEITDDNEISDVDVQMLPNMPSFSNPTAAQPAISAKDSEGKSYIIPEDVPVSIIAAISALLIILVILLIIVVFRD